MIPFLIYIAGFVATPFVWRAYSRWKNKPVPRDFPIAGFALFWPALLIGYSIIIAFKPLNNLMIKIARGE